MQKINDLKMILIELNKINKNFYDLWIRSFEASPYSYQEIFDLDKKSILKQKQKLLEIYSSKQEMYEIIIFSKIKNLVNDFFDIKLKQNIDTYYLLSIMVILIPHLIEGEYKKIDTINYRRKSANLIIGLTYKNFKRWDSVEKSSDDYLISNKIRINDLDDKFLIKKENLKQELERFKILHNHYILVLWDKKDMRFVFRYNFLKIYIWVFISLIIALIVLMTWYFISKTNQ